MKRIAELEAEVRDLRQQNAQIPPQTETVRVPEPFREIFARAQETVRNYFEDLRFSPAKGLIEVNNERYVLIRASALSFDFFEHIRHLYTDRDSEEAFQTGQDFLFDIGHVLGMEDAKCFHKKMNLLDPIEKLSAGPVHFAWSGWAFVDILAQSHPSPDDDYYLKYHHPYSFEADSWLAKGQLSNDAVCIMNAAYSSGWCEASFGIPLSAVEISCRAKGDENCTFIMAPPHRIQGYLEQEQHSGSCQRAGETPLFFNRKISEDQIRASLKEKEVMLQEIHHRVKNNLQIIVSLMGLQLELLEDPKAIEPIRYTQNRIASIAMIHEMLYDSRDFSRIDYRQYIEMLSEQLIKTMFSQPEKVKIQLEIENLFFGINTAIPLSLILNELVTNSLKHTDPEQESIEISIRIDKTAAPKYSLHFSDNGPGMPAEINFARPTSLGLKLIHSLVRQLQGQIELKVHNGTHLTIHFSDITVLA
ncbi:MAG: histidine kinase dimerization/phosphoacceptor domain -containing protein [Candidatus Sericytochromatia bacterium]